MSQQLLLAFFVIFLLNLYFIPSLSLKFIVMNRILTNSILLVMLVLLAAPNSYAGLPISEPVSRVESVKKITKRKKSESKMASVKKRFVNKIVLKRMEGDNKAAAIVFAILIPFVGVAIYQDRISRDFWITLLLTALVYVPGLIYALSIVLKRTR